ncbi:ATP-binding protein [Dongia deserti]|uniref:ATP-binding protein n=1 Tax=Dongia deserti TaxID=2268030 RepID=UPI000E65104F|nr:helix-turn-helix transcriptional regulator [Dongia deserti]
MRLLERESDIQALNSCLERISAGEGRVVLVYGEAGIGKTALLRQFAAGQRAAKGLPARVLWGGCEALFTPHPLAPLYDIARQIGGEFPAALETATKREALFNITIDRLARLPAPAILIFEDVHWADEATLDLIKFLGRRLQGLGLMLVTSYRDDEVGPRHPLRSVIGDLPSRSVHRLHLAPLSEQAVATLAEEMGRSAKELHAVTGGNPFFVTEVLAGSQNNVPQTVRDAVIARMARLSEDALAIANLAALVPGRMERELLDRLAPGAGTAVQDCLAVGMVALEDGSLAFRHELARRAVEEHLPLPQRQALHARILAALLERADVPTARLVHHADLAGDSPAVLRFAPLAAERAAALRSHREAAAHYATALRHAGSLPDEARAELNERLSYECYLTDQIQDAIKAREAALALRRTSGNRLKEGDNARWLSRLSWFWGNKADAERYASEAVEILSALVPGRELAMAYSNRAQLGMLEDNVEAALSWGRKAIDLATTLGDQEILSHALNNVGTARMQADQSGLPDVERALKLALDGGFEEHAARAYTNLATSTVRKYDLARANRYLAEGIAYCEAHDLASWVRYMKPFRAVAHLLEGTWDKAAEDAEAVIRHPSIAPVSKITALIVLGLVRARRGDPDVETPLDEARALALPTGELQRLAPVVVARAEAAWLRGNLAERLEEVRPAYELAGKGSHSWVKGELALWLWRCGERIDELDELAKPFALQIAGNWRAAAAAWQALGCPYEQASALADGDEEKALRRALEILERLGAGPMAGMVRRKLRASGARGIARGPHGQTRQNPQGLTNREMKVLALLTEGCRNADIARRLFVSEKTVDHHVSAILAKLAVRSRGEAAAMANRLGLCAAKQQGDR